MRGGGAGDPETTVSGRKQMAMKGKTNIENRCFAACAAGSRLLSIYPRTARRAPVSESGSHFLLSAGCNFRGWFKSVSQKNDRTNLMRCKIFRGKVSRRKTQNKKYHLETWTHLRQSYE
jgi:hypothetical protein